MNDCALNSAEREICRAFHELIEAWCSIQVTTLLEVTLNPAMPYYSLYGNYMAYVVLPYSARELAVNYANLNAKFNQLD
jgi:hypothetical protein